MNYIRKTRLSEFFCFEFIRVNLCASVAKTLRFRIALGTIVDRPFDEGKRGKRQAQGARRFEWSAASCR